MQWTAVTRVIHQNSRVIGVETSAGRIDAGNVIVAAGAWSVRLCREFGLELPARPKAIDTVAVTRPPDLAKGHMVFIDNVQGNYFRPEGGGLTLVGVPCQEWDIDPDTLGTGLSAQASDLGAQLLMHRIPVMERATLSRGYKAFDGYSADRHAILGRVDGVDSLYLATAFSGSGFKIAPAVGQCMAELVVEGRAKTVDIEAFSLRRFAEGRTVEGPYPYAVRPDYIDPKKRA
jgi:glycine/D-amino acid oxidase-like deaminating enzyme